LLDGEPFENFEHSLALFLPLNSFDTANAHELREIQLMVARHRAQLLETWNEFFGVSGG
jgi:hypothetical protein